MSKLKRTKSIEIISIFVFTIALIIYAYLTFLKGSRIICDKDSVLYSPGEVSYIMFHYDAEGKYLGRDSVISTKQTKE